MPNRHRLWNSPEEFQWKETAFAATLAASQMKRSSTVLLVLSGALLAGCSRNERTDSGVLDPDDTNTYTNNTYRASHGYYHAPYHAWFPMPFGHFMPGRGYYSGGNFQPTPPAVPAMAASSPSQVPKSRVTSSSSSTTSRGGFGSNWRSSSS